MLIRTSQREEGNAQPQSQPSARTTHINTVILKQQWELDKIPRELVNCGLTCLTLFAEGVAKDPHRIVGR